MDANGVRCLVADWGTQDPQIGSLLDKLQGSRQIPYLAIFPAGQPQNVIRLSGLYTRAKLTAALEKAGATKRTAASTEQVADRSDDAAVVMSKLP